MRPQPLTHVCRHVFPRRLSLLLVTPYFALHQRYPMGLQFVGGGLRLYVDTSGGIFVWGITPKVTFNSEGQ